MQASSASTAHDHSHAQNRFAVIEIPAQGIYRYKLVINQTQWLDDPSNGLKEPDEYGGFNSLLHITQ